MNDQRPTRCPCSADSSRNAGAPGVSARSLRNAETGVSQSSTKLAESGIRLWEPASSRACASVGATGSELSATAIEHPLGVAQRPSAAAQQDEQVVEDVGGLFVDALVALLAGGAADLLCLLHHLLPDPRGIVEQLDRVGARRTVACPLFERALEPRQRLVRGRRLALAAVKAGALAGVAGGS